jgi:hypothetical protein
MLPRMAPHRNEKRDDRTWLVILVGILVGLLGIALLEWLAVTGELAF